MAITEICGGRSVASLPSGRGRGRWGGGRFVEIEFHFRRFLGARLRIEEGTRLKSEHAREQICRKTSNRGIERLHRFIEIVALDRDSVFGSLQLGLKRPEIF